MLKHLTIFMASRTGNFLFSELRTSNSGRCFLNLLGCFLIILSVIAWGSPAFSGPLNEQKLLATIYERLITDKKMEGLKSEDIVLTQKIPVTVGSWSFWATKVRVKWLAPNEDPKKEAVIQLLDFITVTDDEGQFHFDNITDLKTGIPLLEKALAELIKVQVNPRLGQVIATGKGDKTIILIVNNFCPHCREAYKKIPNDYKELFKEVVTFYSPSGGPLGSELACLVSSYIHRNRDLKEYAKAVDDFIFQELNQPQTKDPKEANELVLIALKNKFPWLNKEFSDLSMEKIIEKLKAGSNFDEQVQSAGKLVKLGIPVILVDGKRIDGLDFKQLERFLTY